MILRAFPLTCSAASSGLMWAARWMLVLLLATDLIGSPFHAHHHDGGPDNYLSHTSQALDDAADETADLAASALHVDSSDAVKGGHSMSALRGTSVQVANSESCIEQQAVVPLFVFAGLFSQPVLEVFPGWRPGAERVPIPSFRTVPPDSRAPPLLQV